MCSDHLHSEMSKRGKIYFSVSQCRKRFWQHQDPQILKETFFISPENHHQRKKNHFEKFQITCKKGQRISIKMIKWQKLSKVGFFIWIYLVAKTFNTALLNFDKKMTSFYVLVNEFLVQWQGGQVFKSSPIRKILA